MNDLKIAKEIVRKIEQNHSLQVEDMEAWLLDKPDKCDPFNRRVVLGVKARINGKPGAWVIQTSNNNDRDELVSRLIDCAVEEIVAKPCQDASSADANPRSVS